MNAKEAANKWNVHLNTVYSYLKDGLIQNAYKNQNGHWVIDDHALKPFVIKGSKFFTEEKIYQTILSALNKRESISSNQIAGLEDYFYVLEQSGNIVKLKNKTYADLFTQYKPTQQGLETLKSKTKLVELVKLGLEILSFL